MQSQTLSAQMQKFKLVQQSFAYLCERFEETKGTISLWGKYNRRIKVNRNILKDEIILEIHQRYFINSNMKTTEQSYLLQYFENLKIAMQFSKKQQNSKLSKMIAFLQDQYERFQILVYLIQKIYLNTITHSDSEVEDVHNHYINTLPRNFNYHPFNFIQQIKSFHSYMSYFLAKSNRKLNKFLRNVMQLLSNSYLLSFKQFLTLIKKGGLYSWYINAFSAARLVWAIQVMQTHSYSSNGLIPLFGLFHHSKNSNAEWKFNDRQGKLSLSATRNINAEQQIFVDFAFLLSMQGIFCTYGTLSMLDSSRLEIPRLKDKRAYIYYKQDGLPINFWREQKTICNKQCKGEYCFCLTPELINCQKSKAANWRNLKHYITHTKMSERQFTVLFSVLKIIEAEQQFLTKILESSDVQVRYEKGVKRSKKAKGEMIKSSFP